MTLRLRLLIAFLVLTVPAFYYFIDFAINNVRPRYLETVEESMNDTANILAASAELDLRGTRPTPDRLRQVFTRADQRRFDARIYDFSKSRVHLRTYLTDQNGIVLFDSGGEWEGLDFSRWNDVHLTLRGKYGARSTRTDPNSKQSGAYYVAAPVRDVDGNIRGVLTVAKPKDVLSPFIDQARHKLLEAGITTAGGFLVLLFLVTLWITRPIARLHSYVRDARERRNVKLPHLGGTEIKALGRAFEEMRLELEGKRYVESYVQTFTHELKSPLTALYASAELLEDDLNQAERARFVANIKRESARIQELVERMLQLSALENRPAPLQPVRLTTTELLAEAAERSATRARAAGVSLHTLDAHPAALQGEAFLLHQALGNLVENAIDFTPQGGRIDLSSEKTGDGRVLLRVADTGSGIPSYAIDRIFERFYSLPRPHGRRSTGLGLAFVRETALLHGGEVHLSNREEGGTVAELILPSAD